MPTQCSGSDAGQVLQEINRIISQVIGVEPHQIESRATLTSLGADSLTLLQLSQAIHDRFGVRIPFRLMFDEISTPAAMSECLLREMPNGALATNADAVSASEVSDVARTEMTSPLPTPAGDGLGVDCDLGMVERIMAMQLRVMDQQLNTLAALPTAKATMPRLPVPENRGQAKFTPVPEPATTKAQPEPEAKTLSQKLDPEPYVAHRRIERPSGLGGGGLSSSQQEYLDWLTTRLTRKTASSKSLAEQYRPVLADSRQSSGFHTAWKELCYPLVVDRADGSHIWDADGNEYLDITMGFGALLFGHTPPFITDALRNQVGLGLHLGLQSKLAGQAAALICELTGVERAAFCNSGTEAVMSALRLARKATARTRIAMFAGAYHGSFDGVLVRGERSGDTLRTAPLVAGIPQHMVENVTVLEYGRRKSLERLREEARQCAAIIVEPTQSRRPDLQPVEFLKALRGIADESGAVLIFDEVVTGFRTHPGGAQAVFGVPADLVIYGKALGGGVPIGVVAGRAKYMDGIDGGSWKYGDASFPEVETTFFAGTYFKHPLVVAAVHATLSHLKQQGPRLQQELTSATANMVARLNGVLDDFRVPVRAVSFGSLFRFIAPRNIALWDLFYYGLLDRGVYVSETRTCFLSTAHTSADVDFLTSAVAETVRDMKKAGLLPEGSPEGIASHAKPVQATTQLSNDPVTVPLTSAQSGLLSLCMLGPEFSRAYNESMALRMSGRLERHTLMRAIDGLVNRHQSLRACIRVEDAQQVVYESVHLPVRDVDLAEQSSADQDRQLQQILESEGRGLFDLTRAPLIRVCLVRLGAEQHILCFTAHHLVIDGWSFGLLLDELGQLYTAELRGVPAQLAPAVPITDFVRRRQDEQQSAKFLEAEQYWLDRFSGRVQPLELPPHRPRPSVQSFRGARHRLIFEDGLRRSINMFAARNACSPFTFLLASAQWFLHELIGQNDIIVGTHSAGQTEFQGSLVGFCLTMLPIRAHFDDQPTFETHLARVRTELANAYKHQGFPISRLIKRLRLPRDPSRPPLVSMIVNLDRVATAGRSLRGSVMAGLEVETLELPVVNSRFDMLWNFLQTPEQLSLSCTYNRDLFDSSSVSSWLERYVAQIESIVREPDLASSGSARTASAQPV